MGSHFSDESFRNIVVKVQSRAGDGRERAARMLVQRPHHNAGSGRGALWSLLIQKW